MRQTLRCGAVLLVLLAIVILAGCKSGYRSTAEVSVSGGDVVYLRDERTGLCFAVLALQNPVGTRIREMAMTGVPCENLRAVTTR